MLQALTLATVALLILPGYLFYFDVTPKVVVLLAATAFLLLFSRLRGSVFGWLLAANALSLAVSALFSANPPLSWFGGNWRRFGMVEQCAVMAFAWLVATHAAGRPDRVRVILRGVAAAGFASGCYGILQYFGIDPFLPPRAYHVGEGIWTIVRPPGTMGYVSYFAAWLVYAVFLSLALAEFETNPYLRAAARVAAAVAGFALLLTGTRAALVGLLAGFAVLLYRHGFRVTRKQMAVAAIALIGSVAFYYSPPGWPLRSRARWFVEDPRGGARLLLFRDSLRMSLHRPATGYGPEVFTAQFPHFESKQLAEAYPDFSHESPHNMFLDALVAQGIPGLILLAAVCVLGLRQAVSPELAAGLAAGIVTQQFMVFTLPVALAFYVTVGILTALRCKAPAPSQAPRRFAFYAAYYAAAAPAAAGLLYLAVRLTLADRQLELAQRAVNARSVTLSASHYAAYGRLRLPGSSADLWYSRAMAGVAHDTRDNLGHLLATAQAGIAALRATETGEDPFNAWYNVAELYASQNDAPRAEQSLRRAIQAHPNWFKPHWMLAQILLMEGRGPEARSEAAVALELDAAKHQEVAATLQKLKLAP